MNRRGFLTALVGLPFLPSALAAAPHWLWGTEPLPMLPQRKIMARVRITQELIEDSAWARNFAFYQGPQWLTWEPVSETWEAAITHEARRLILDLTPPEHRFVDTDGVVLLA